MFLGVRATLSNVDTTEADRALLAERITAERIRQYGAKSAAYQAAGLNSATWDRIERGDSVRDDRLIAAVKLLWPASGGDWRKAQTAQTEPRSIEEWLADIEARVASLERARDEQERADGRDPAPKTSAGRAPASRARVTRIADPDRSAASEPDPSARRPRRRPSTQG